MDNGLERLIDAIAADGNVTEYERDVLMREAERLGVDRGVVEILISAAVHRFENARPSADAGRTQKSLNGDRCCACGGQLEPVFAHCPWCKAPVFNTSFEGMDTTELLARAGEWIGALRNGKLTRTKGPAYDEAVTFVWSEIVVNAAKYLAVLELKATHSPDLRDRAAEMRREFEMLEEKNRKRGLVQERQIDANRPDPNFERLFIRIGLPMFTLIAIIVVFEGSCSGK